MKRKSFGSARLPFAKLWVQSPTGTTVKVNEGENELNFAEKLGSILFKSGEAGTSPSVPATTRAGPVQIRDMKPGNGSSICSALNIKILEREYRKRESREMPSLTIGYLKGAFGWPLKTVTWLLYIPINHCI